MVDGISAAVSIVGGVAAATKETQKNGDETSDGINTGNKATSADAGLWGAVVWGGSAVTAAAGKGNSSSGGNDANEDGCGAHVDRGIGFERLDFRKAEGLSVK